jgi:hypothetical protein
LEERFDIVIGVVEFGRKRKRLVRAHLADWSPVPSDVADFVVLLVCMCASLWW